jgi:small subunit ribosomal protein S6
MLLDPGVEDTDRAKIVADTRAAIEAKGELVRHDEWGERALTYPIDRKGSAEYHLLQFHVGDKELLGGLDHTLRITDGLLRFRIIKLKPGVPDAPDMRAAAVRRPDAETETRSQAEAEAPVAATPVAATPETAAEPAATPEPAAAPAEPAAAAVAEVAVEPDDGAEQPAVDGPAPDPA